MNLSHNLPKFSLALVQENQYTDEKTRIEYAIFCQLDARYIWQYSSTANEMIYETRNSYIGMFVYNRRVPYRTHEARVKRSLELLFQKALIVFHAPQFFYH